MYLNEYLPDCIAAGMTAEEFWHSYPKEVKPYFKALEKRRRAKDEEQYAQYIYFSNAIDTALYNAFRGRGKKALERFNEPLMKTYENEHRELTEAEKRASVEMLFDNLGLMQKKFESSKEEGR